jgi:hypothetical protein
MGFQYPGVDTLKLQVPHVRAIALCLNYHCFFILLFILCIKLTDNLDVVLLRMFYPHTS